MVRAAALASSLLAVAACRGASNEEAPRAHGDATRAASFDSRATASSSATAREPESSPRESVPLEGDPKSGEKLVLTFECNRCHDATGHPAIGTEQHCTHCHEDISTGRFGAGTPKIVEWKRSVAPYRYAPSLKAVGQRFERAWMVDFLRKPYDLRPHLAATMPRLNLTESQAADLAAYLMRDAAPKDASANLDGADSGAGRALMETKGCGSCHEFSGVAPLSARPSLSAANDRLKKAIELAPDLRHVRERFRPDRIVAWLLDPPSVKSDTEMPSHAFTRSEAQNVAAYLLRAELARPATTPPAARLPLLARRVGYREVENRVLSVTCRHCHADPDSAGGDGGPGNTGGFGFRARGLDLSSYGSIQAGYLDDHGERRSVFEKNEQGVPFLVAALLARHAEEADAPTGPVRGMPLGLPSVSLQDIQLVDTWIAQGRPR